MTSSNCGPHTELEGHHRKSKVRKYIPILQSFAEPCDSQTVAEFGNDSKNIQRGWITSETVVQLKFLGDEALNIWKKRHKGKEFHIKVTPVKANRQNFEDSLSEDSQSMDLNGARDTFQRWPILEVAVSYTWCSFGVLVSGRID